MNEKKQPTLRSNIWAFLNELPADKGITEVIINGPKNLFVEKGGQIIRLEIALTPEEIHSFVEEVAAINQIKNLENSPIIDGILPDGSRINVIIPPYTREFPAITIRRFTKSLQKFEQNPQIFKLSEHWVHFLKILVNARVNILISGGTAVGKTTFLNLLLQEISKKERLISIEDTREINITHPNHVQLESGGGYLTNKQDGKLGMRELVKNTLRMRPDRIIIGEVRGGEVFDLLQAMNTGHDGSMASIHASSPSECLKRICTLYLVAGFEVPMNSIREQVSSAVDFIVQIGRNPEGERVVNRITELTGMEGANFLLQDIAVYQPGGLKGTGTVPASMERLVKAGLERDYFKKLS